jgi:transcriptional regulator with XRE-family HTH domain
MNAGIHFGQNLATQRRRAGLSQEQLADRAGLHRTAISLSETGKRNPRLDTLVKLAEALGIPVGALVDGIPGADRGTDDR